MTHRDTRLMGTLVEMLTYCRPHGSLTENYFIERFIAPLPNAERDPDNNWHVTVGESAVLWSCHTDTVHRLGGRQRVHVNSNGTIQLARRERGVSACLGADDTTGVFIMVEMIQRKVPGHYIFHYGEEAGCIGSGNLASHNPEFLKQFKCAIALDRRGYKDIITHQTGGKTASDAFADSLAAQLNEAGLEYKPSSHGVYTDTAQYEHLISECTNLSVGYESAHSGKETVDAVHVIALLDALTDLDQTKLVYEREPGDTGPRYTYSSVSYGWDDEQWEYLFKKGSRSYEWDPVYHRNQPKQFTESQKYAAAPIYNSHAEKPPVTMEIGGVRYVRRYGQYGNGYWVPETFNTPDPVVEVAEVKDTSASKSIYLDPVQDEVQAALREDQRRFAETRRPRLRAIGEVVKALKSGFTKIH